MTARLEGRGAVVTGAGSGIGAATARRLAEAGAAVALASRSGEPIERLAGELGRAGMIAHAIPCDVSDEASVKRLGEEARDAMGAVDILVGAAGMAASSAFRAISAAAWDEMMAVNARGAFLCAREFASEMADRGWGRVLLIASFAGLAGGKYIAHYSASKHAVVGLARSLALELAGTGVTVNAICPGYVDTPMTDRTVQNIEARTGRSRAEAVKMVLATTGQERLVAPREVAEEVLRLCGEEARAITGETPLLGAGARLP